MLERSDLTRQNGQRMCMSYEKVGVCVCGGGVLLRMRYLDE